MKHGVAFAVALALVGLSSSAAAAEGAGGFLRLEAGSNKLDISTNFDVSASERDNGFGVRGGYFFNPSFAIEGFYTTYGEAAHEDRYSVFWSTGVVEYVERSSAEVSAFGVGVVGKTNFGGDNTGFYLNGRAGLARAKTDAGFTISGSDGFRDGESQSATSTKPYFGVGMGYDFSPKFGLTANYDWVQAEFDRDGLEVSTDVDSLTLGAEFRF